VTDVGSVERLARTRTRQPLTNGIRASNQTTRQRNTLPDASEIPVTTADFYFALEYRPLLVFVDGRVHLGKSQSVKDEELRSLLRKKGYRILELCYGNYSDKSRDHLYGKILDALGRDVAF